MSYSGWKNKETWLVCLHDFFDEYYKKGQFKSLYDLEDAMKSDFRAFIDEHRSENILVSDLLSCAVHEIDFAELAEELNNSYGFVRVENSQCL
jgi:hypothetical protein